MKNLKRLRVRHYAWSVVLGIAGIWWPLFIIASPPESFVQGRVDTLILNICMSVAVVGSATKILGYLASQFPGRVGVLGVSVELVGLILAAVGPFAYIASSLALIADGEARFNSAVIFAIAILAMYLYRAIIIVPRFFFEAHDTAKDETAEEEI